MFYISSFVGSQWKFESELHYCWIIGSVLVCCALWHNKTTSTYRRNNVWPKNFVLQVKLSESIDYFCDSRVLVRMKSLTPKINFFQKLMPCIHHVSKLCHNRTLGAWSVSIDPIDCVWSVSIVEVLKSWKVFLGPQAILIGVEWCEWKWNGGNGDDTSNLSDVKNITWSTETTHHSKHNCDVIYRLPGEGQ